MVPAKYVVPSTEMHSTTQCFQNVPPYFATVVSYERKLFVKLTPD